MLKRISLAVAVSIFLTPALGHHSFGMFDMEARVALEGAIRRFDWKNPHVIIWVAVESKDGDEPETWGIESTSPGNLMRAGWTKRSLNPGDRVSVTISPLRNGERGGAFRSLQNLTSGEALEYDWNRLGQVQSGSDKETPANKE